MSESTAALEALQRENAALRQRVAKLEQIELHVRESEATYRQHFENSQEGLALHELIVDGPGDGISFRLLDANAAYTRQTGSPHADLRDPAARAALTRIDPRSLERLNQVALTGEPLDIECYSASFQRHFRLRIFGLQPDRLAIGVEDITPRKQAEASLQASEAKYRLLFENMQEGFALHEIITDDTGHAVDFRFLDANAAFEEHVGFKPQDIIGKTMLEVQPQADPRQIEAYGRVALTGEPLAFEYYSKTFNRHVRVKAFSPERGRFATLFEDITERQQAEEALHDSEARWSFALEGSGDGVWDWDATTDGVFFSRQWKAMLGFADEEIGSALTEWSDRVHPDDLPDVMEKVQAHFRGETPVYQSEHRLRAKDGTYRWILDRGKVISRTPDGRPQRVVGTHTDLTNRKRLEEAVRQSEALLAAIFQSSPMGINLFRLADGQSVLVNETYLDLVGYTREEVIAHTAAELNLLVDPGIRARWLNALQAGQTVYNQETVIRRKSGELRHVLTSLDVVDRDGEPLVMVIATDLTERMQMEQAEHRQRIFAEALRDTAAALNSTLELAEVLDRVLVNAERVVAHSTANLMLIDDGVARIVRHRGYAERGLTDFAARLRLTVSAVPTLQHMVDTSRAYVVPDVALEPNWIYWPESSYIHSMASAPIRVQNVTIGFINLNSATPGFYSTLDGEHLQAFADQAAVALENARLYETVQHYADALEQRVTERTAELQVANEQLKELDRLKDEFLSRISHELRTPLTSIIIYLDLLTNGKPEKRDKYLQTATREAEKLQTLIEDVLLFSQLGRPAQPSRLDRINVNDWIEGRLTTWQTLVARHNLALQLNLASNLPLTYADAELVVQILIRVMSNAVNYTPSGSVTLATAPRAADGQPWVTISVTDTGPGITAADLPHIFERFYRGRAAADYKTSGTGIGLSISREIAERMNGRLTVDTQVGVGSTFTLWLPAV